jgi:hypothetical protein
MKNIKWFLILSVALLASSITVYALQILIFRNTHETVFLLFQDLAFLPVHTLIVVLILEKLLKRIERQTTLRKLSMAVGVFFTEAGTDLLRMLSGFDKTRLDVMGWLKVGINWKDSDFADARKKLSAFAFETDAREGNLEDLQAFYSLKQPAIMKLLENPNLLEHESFTDMLLAVSHLGEELSMRKDMKQISEKDTDHMSVDIRRAYIALVAEWLGHMQRLKKEYPYLYSLAVRTNPFNPDAKVEFD